MDRRLSEAARARAQGVQERWHRPAERRMSEAPKSGAVVRAAATVDVRAKADDSGEKITFHGVASVTERGYEMWDYYGPYTEVVAADAFDESLARADLDVPLVLGHDPMRRIARTTNGTLTLSVTDEGLDVLAELDPADADVAYIVPKLRSGLIDEMSFMFRIDAGQWSPDYTEYRITKVEIHRGDTAIVGYGANPATSGELRERPAAPQDFRARMLALAIAR